MSTSGGNAYLDARVSVLAARLTPPAQWERLTGLSLDELARRRGLEALLEEGLPVATRLRVVEGALIRTLLSELSVLMRPMSGEARELAVHWARKFELYNLKALIRGKLGSLSEQDINANLHELPAFLALPHGALLRTESVLELLRQLEQGAYRAIASQAREVYEEHREPFALEATIDQRYLMGLVKRARQLKDGDLREVQQVLGLQLDLTDLLWLLRYRFVYGLSPSEAYYQLVPSTLHLHRERLLKLVNLPSLERVLEAMPPPLDALLEGAGTLAEVERRMEALTVEATGNRLAHSPSAVARALAYLVLRELDLKRLFSLIQAHLLGLGGPMLRTALGLEPGAAPREGLNA